MDFLNMLIFLIGGGVTLTAYLVTVGLIFPKPVARTGQFIQTSPWKSFLIGVVNSVFFVVIAALLFNFAQNEMTGILAGIVVLIALTIVLVLGILVSLGLVGLSKWLEDQITMNSNVFMDNIRSALLLVLACMAPFVGWFLLTPFVLALSLGIAIQTFFQRKKNPIPV